MTQIEINLNYKGFTGLILLLGYIISVVHFVRLGQRGYSDFMPIIDLIILAIGAGVCFILPLFVICYLIFGEDDF